MPCRLIRVRSQGRFTGRHCCSGIPPRQNAKAPVPGMGRWGRDQRWLADWEVAWSAAGPQWTKRFWLRGQRERRTMTAAQAESLDTKGVRSLEVRWILPGQLTATAADWFGRFPAETRMVEDTYLLDPHLPGLSVKVRGGRALEVKMYCGSPGLLELAGCAHGRLESWHKWSFPHDPAGPGTS